MVGLVCGTHCTICHQSIQVISKENSYSQHKTPPSLNEIVKILWVKPVKFIWWSSVCDNSNISTSLLLKVFSLTIIFDLTTSEIFLFLDSQLHRSSNNCYYGYAPQWVIIIVMVTVVLVVTCQPRIILIHSKLFQFQFRCIVTLLLCRYGLIQIGKLIKKLHYNSKVKHKHKTLDKKKKEMLLLFEASIAVAIPRLITYLIRNHCWKSCAMIKLN